MSRLIYATFSCLDRIPPAECSCDVMQVSEYLLISKRRLQLLGLSPWMETQGDSDRGGGEDGRARKKAGLSTLKPASDAGFEGYGDPHALHAGGQGFESPRLHHALTSPFRNSSAPKIQASKIWRWTPDRTGAPGKRTNIGTANWYPGGNRLEGLWTEAIVDLVSVQRSLGRGA
jgi:hypothetical protein